MSTLQSIPEHIQCCKCCAETDSFSAMRIYIPLNFCIAVDINPAKHGLFLPGTGQQVVAPAGLRDLDIGLVLVMNPVYADEIAGMVAAQGVTAPVVGV